MGDDDEKFVEEGEDDDEDVDEDDEHAEDELDEKGMSMLLVFGCFY